MALTKRDLTDEYRLVQDQKMRKLGSTRTDSDRSVHGRIPAQHIETATTATTLFSNIF